MSEGRTAGGLPPARLIVVDLHSSTLARPFVQWAASRAIRRATMDRPERGTCHLLLHAPDDHDAGWTRGVPVSRPVDLLTGGELEACQRWTRAAALEIVSGRGRPLFPQLCNVSFADLNLLEIQTYLLDYSFLAGAMRALLSRRRFASCQVFTADPDRAACLRSAAEPLVERVAHWSPPLLPELRNHAAALRALRRRAPLSRRRTERRPGSLAPELRESLFGVQVLTISETQPMAETFSATEARMRGPTSPETIRIQFGGKTFQRQREGKTTTLLLDRPCAVAPAETGRFRRHWREARAAAEATRFDASWNDATLQVPLTALLRHLYLDLFDQQFEHLRFAREILDETRPELLVVGNDRWWVGLTFVLLARLRGIPSLCVQDGMTGDNVFWSWLSADRLAASSGLWPELLVRHGVAVERLFVTGQPRYDALCGVRDGAAAPPPDLAEGVFHVLVATQPHQTVEYAREVVGAVLRIPDVQVILRPHPSEPRGKYAQLGWGEDRVRSHPSGSILRLLLAADVLVTEFSTVAVEAAVLGVPVITAQFGGRPSLISFSDHGFATSVRSADELVEAVRRQMVAGAARRGPPPPSVEAVVGPVDGRAGDRLAAVILDSLAHSRSVASPVGA